MAYGFGGRGIRSTYTCVCVTLPDLLYFPNRSKALETVSPWTRISNISWWSWRISSSSFFCSKTSWSFSHFASIQMICWREKNNCKIDNDKKKEKLLYVFQWGLCCQFFPNCVDLHLAFFEIHHRSLPQYITLITQSCYSLRFVSSKFVVFLSLTFFSDFEFSFK
jgi:hypothetical protein